MSAVGVTLDHRGEPGAVPLGAAIASLRLVLKAEASQPRRYRVPYGRRSSGADLRIPMRTLSVEPRLLYHALRWYHSNPDARAELADERSVDRIQRCDVYPSWL